MLGRIAITGYKPLDFCSNVIMNIINIPKLSVRIKGNFGFTSHYASLKFNDSNELKSERMFCRIPLA